MSWPGGARVRSLAVGAAAGVAGSTRLGAAASDGDRSRFAAARADLGRSTWVIRALLVVLLVGMLAMIGASAPPVTAAVALSLGLLVLAAEADRRTNRLPDRLLLLAGLPTVLLVSIAMITGRWQVLVAAVVGAVIAAAPVAALHAVSPEAMGFGDVKATVVMGGALGVIEPRLGPAALALAALSALLVARATGRRRIALGPHLVAGAFLVVAAWTALGLEPSPW